jgi:pectate disaccharide-lyase
MKNARKTFIGLVTVAITALLILTGCSLPTSEVNETVNAYALLATASTVTIEAESMSKSGYSNESNTSASGGIVIKLSGTTGTVTKNFTGVTSTYDITVTYVDQTSGAATFTLYSAGTVIGTWTGDQASSSDLFLTKTFSNISIANGAQIKLTGTKNGSELAKFDVIKFVPSGTSSSTASSSTIVSSSAAVSSSKTSSSVVISSSAVVSSSAAVSSSVTASSSSKASSSSSKAASSTATSSSSSSFVVTDPMTTIYISPSGSDSNAGTLASPFYSLSTAVNHAVAGTTIYVRGGTFNYSSTVNLTQSGTSSSPITIIAYTGEQPVFNYSTQAYAAANRGIVLSGNYWYIKGLEICYAGDNGMKLEGSYNTIELCVFHHNGDSGLQLGFGHVFSDTHPGISSNDGSYCAYNQIINCDSYYNFDFDSKGGDADGFSCKMHQGKGNVFKGCRSYHNSDDGWDLFETDYAVEIINCWTWHNGDKADFTDIYLAKMGTTMSSFSGNGNGFKLGGNGTGGSSVGTHIVKNCIAFDTVYGSKKGFDQNSHKGGVQVYNCVSFANTYNYMFEDAPNSGSVMEFKNCVSFDKKGSLEYEFNSAVTQVNNSWNLSVTADYSDFKSTAVDLALAARQSDGSLPDNDFAKLVSGSDLIDAGVNVGTSYNGSAPDLGAFEY